MRSALAFVAGLLIAFIAILLLEAALHLVFAMPSGPSVADPAALDQAMRAIPTLGEHSDTILEELQALRKIIDEFSEFARMPQPVLEPTDLNAVVEQTLALYQAQANGCRVEAALGQDLPTLAADRVLLGRAIGNLIANALEAMPGGGALRVRTSRRPGGLCVEVEDTGPGLTEEQRTRLFTPYFTTKKGGTGLGLSIVQGIVTDHGGRIEVRSEPGQGTTFTLILPLAAS